MDLNRVIVWINKTEGRDKFCKIIQYGSRFLKWYLAESNKDVAARFAGLFSGMKDARKLFRLFKSLNEFHKILDIINKGGVDTTEIALSLISRLGFLLYWVFDNLVVLCTVKFIKDDAKKYSKIGATFWLIALISNLIRNVTDPEAHEKKMNVVKKKQFDSVLGVVKTVGDIIPASQGSEVYPKLFNRNFNDGWLGIGGLVSAGITTYQLY